MNKGGAGLFLAASLLALAEAARSNEIISYGYDSLGRLVRVERTGTVNNGVNAHYAYDSADNRTTYSATAVATPPQPQPQPQPQPPTPPPPAFSVSGGSADEGGNLVFTISRSNQTAGTFTVNYATSNGSAAQYSDYNPSSGTLTFTSGASQTVNVATIADTAAEPAETVLMTLSNPTGGAAIQAGGGEAAGTINASAAPPPPGNQPPVAANDSGAEVMRCEYMGVLDPLTNDYDPEDTQIDVVDASYSGSLGTAMAARSRIRFMPNNSGTGTAVIAYTISDAGGATASATFTLNVVQGQC